MGPEFIRGLRCIERRDNTALLCLRSDDPAMLARLAAAFPRRLALTRSPAGDYTLLCTETDLDSGLTALPSALPRRICRGLSHITVSGVCMSAAENKGRRICAAIARDGIPLYAPSLCDLALSFAVPTDDAKRVLDRIVETVPLVR